MDRKYFVFDVECAGLHGQAFALGYVVITADGEKLQEGIVNCPMPYMPPGPDCDWMCDNVLPHLPEPTLKHPRDLIDYFRLLWNEWKDKDCWLVADCLWPAESNFLHTVCCGIDNQKNSPYPFIDLNGVLLGRGCDPIGTYERLKDERPEHNPLHDARQSARLLIESLRYHETAHSNHLKTLARESDESLADQLTQVLLPHAGERQTDEGAVDCLKRIIRERDEAMVRSASTKRSKRVKELKAGKVPGHTTPEWVGKVAKCLRCETEQQLEPGDAPNLNIEKEKRPNGKTKVSGHCPTSGCGGTLYLEYGDSFGGGQW